MAQRIYNMAKSMSDMNIPYSQGTRSLGLHPSSADCSSSVSWALLHAGVHLPGGAGVGSRTLRCQVSSSIGAHPVRAVGDHMEQTPVTYGCNSPTGSAPRGALTLHRMARVGYGPHLRFTSRPTSGFIPRHWPGT